MVGSKGGDESVVVSVQKKLENKAKGSNMSKSMSECKDTALSNKPCIFECESRVLRGSIKMFTHEKS